MSWLAWRLFRAQGYVALALLACLGVLAVATGPHLADLYSQSGTAGCSGDRCSGLAQSFLRDAKSGLTGAFYSIGALAVIAFPVLAGVFWGAPLVSRELEAGTHRVAWTQSVTRTRWLLPRLGVALGAAAVTAGLASLALTWWASPIDSAQGGRLQPATYLARGIVPVGYALLAVAVGVLLGAVLRRTVTAMATTFAVVAAVMLAFSFWLRVHLLPPVHANVPLELSDLQTFAETNGGHMEVVANFAQKGALVLTNRTLTPDGTLFVGPADPTQCDRNLPGQQCLDWVGSLGLRQDVTYQPASRFWELQLVETGILVALAAAAVGLCVWWVRRRLG
ncbi:ABC transporter permease subunit [Luteimicrobium sp. DT211]|uniref:ABC transporter permease subunit n=1 Tax=Luteimicrobium sp. DT211 TaxID=3393412 RepID=UPI003CF02F8D